MTEETHSHTAIVRSLHAITKELAALKRAGLEIDDGQLLSVLDLVDSGLQQVLKHMEPEEETKKRDAN